jgi:hypothetical protein
MATQAEVGKSQQNRAGKYLTFVLAKFQDSCRPAWASPVIGGAHDRLGALHGLMAGMLYKR